MRISDKQTKDNSVSSTTTAFAVVRCSAFCRSLIWVLHNDKYPERFSINHCLLDFVEVPSMCKRRKNVVALRFLHSMIPSTCIHFFASFYFRLCLSRSVLIPSVHTLPKLKKIGGRIRAHKALKLEFNEC